MNGNGKVFVSHAHEDNSRCAALLAALDAWGIDYWFDAERLDAGQDLSQRIQQAISERDIFVRICTPAAQNSYWVSLETGAFRGLQAKEHQGRQSRQRMLINLILDKGYQPEPFDYAHVFIDATSKSQREWMQEMARALHVVGPHAQAANPPVTSARSMPLTPQRISVPVKPTIERAEERGIPRLVVRQGKDRGKVFTLHADGMPIGSSSTWPIQLDDSAVNPYHASIIKIKRERIIKDHGSKHGTFVNGQLIDGQHFLKEGDEIRVGTPYSFSPINSRFQNRWDHCDVIV